MTVRNNVITRVGKEAEVVGGGGWEGGIIKDKGYHTKDKDLSTNLSLMTNTETISAEKNRTQMITATKQNTN